MQRNKFLLFAFILMPMIMKAQHPFRYDNTDYKAIYLNEAFQLMDTMQNFLLLDVRSPGEYADTSRATALNIGRFKGSVNISIDSIHAHMEELRKYKDQPIFIYCSHSQRSRRVSKLLADSGFLKVYNINGGMTLVNEYDNKQFPYKNKMLVTHTSYKNIASMDAFNLIQDKPDLLIIDIRSEQEFAGKDSLKQNNIGQLKNAINIPQALFTEKLISFHFANTRPVLLYDLRGVNSMDVVELLRARGFTRIYNLFGGLEDFICDHALMENGFNPLIADPPSWRMLDTKAFIDLLSERQNLVILDARTIEEFNNTSTPAYRNLGRIKGAIHVSSLDTLEKIVEQQEKSTRFLVYGSNKDFGYLVCQALMNQGFRQVNFLSQGFYEFVWSTANVENCKTGRAFLINHEGLY